MMDILIGLILFIGVVCYGICAFRYLQERRIWNNGVCRETGTPWLYFHYDDYYARHCYQSLYEDRPEPEVYCFSYYTPSLK